MRLRSITWKPGATQEARRQAGNRITLWGGRIVLIRADRWIVRWAG